MTAARRSGAVKRRTMKRAAQDDEEMAGAPHHGGAGHRRCARFMMRRIGDACVTKHSTRSFADARMPSITPTGTRPNRIRGERRSAAGDGERRRRGRTRRPTAGCVPDARYVMTKLHVA